MQERTVFGFFRPFKPGFNVQPLPEEEAPGFRMNPDGSTQQGPVSTSQLFQDIGGGSPFDVSDHLGAEGFTPAQVAWPPPYLTYAGNQIEGFSDALRRDLVQPPGVPPFAPASPNPAAAGSPFYFGTPSLPFGVESISPVSGRRPPSDELQPPPSSFNYVDPATDLAWGVQRNVLPESDGSISGRTSDPNVVRVADPPNAGPNEPASPPISKADDPAVEGFNPIPAPARLPAPQSRLRKDPSPGVPVVLPDRSTIVDSESPTGQLMAPVADLGDVAAAGREAKQKFRALAVTPILAQAYQLAALGWNVGQGGTFDYQRRGNRVTGFTHLQQFEKVSNLNVGLFAQQAGLTLGQALDVAGLFARNFSSNADPRQPYGLSATQLKFITMGYKIGESGMYDKPPLP